MNAKTITAMKKHLSLLAVTLTVLCMVVSGCEKPDDDNNNSNPGGESPSSKIISTIYDTPVEIFRNGKIDIAGNELWFNMLSEGTALHYPFGGVKVLCDSSDGPDMAIPLQEGDEIGPSSGYFSSDQPCFINWYFLGDYAYCGISFQKDGKTHYGWVKFKFVTTSCRAWIYGFAYEDVPEKSISAGAM